MEKIEILELFYTKLAINLLHKYKKEKYKSIIPWFFEIKSNDRLRLLYDSRIGKSRFIADDIDILIKAKLIQGTGEFEEYVITAYGVWEYEINKNIISLDKLIEHINQKYFNEIEKGDKPLSEKHKIILLSMIAARAFSETSAVSLHSEEQILNTWEEIIWASYKLLKDLKVVSEMTDLELFGKRGNEHKVGNFIRHSDGIPKGTKGIFTAAGDNKYYLNLYKDNSINNIGLEYLFKVIFGDIKIPMEEIDNICTFLDKIAATKSIYIFDKNSHKFHHPRYDTIIRDALLKI